MHHTSQVVCHDEPHLILESIKPTLIPSTDPEPSSAQSLINALNLTPHIEGGYYSLSYSSPTTIPSPWPSHPLSNHPSSMALIQGQNHRPGYDPSVRRTASCIFYYLSPHRPVNRFNSNRGIIVHTLHQGRGRIVLIHPDGRVETFIAGRNVERGERLSWVVEGGVFKASYVLLPESGSGDKEETPDLLITETVVPGWELDDFEFLSLEKCKELIGERKTEELKWLVQTPEDGLI